MIVFSHANSYGSGTYRYIFKALEAAGHGVAAVERFGHDPRYPPGRNWFGMVHELTALIDNTTAPKIWLLGHSMGGYLSLLAASLRSHRLQGVILLDSPVLSGWKSGLIAAVKATGQMRRVSPAAVSMKRRNHWSSIDEVRQHFAAKPQFARWHPEVLNDYVCSGTEADPADPRGSARRLRFHRDVESAIYATLPHWLNGYLQRHPPGVPIAFFGGRRSREIEQVGLAAVRRLSHGRLSWIDGSHLFPFEKPDETVAEILAWISRLREVKQA